MKTYLEAIKSHIESHPPNFGDGESVLTMLYESYSEHNSADNESIRADRTKIHVSSCSFDDTFSLIMSNNFGSSKCGMGRDMRSIHTTVVRKRRKF